MVRALLDGRKTQTRRVVKPAKSQSWLSEDLLNRSPSAEFVPSLGLFKHPLGGPLTCIKPPYGVPGDRLWVREAHAFPNDHAVIYRANWREDAQARGFDNIPADDSGIKWRPSIHMPRTASRISLQITDLRLERLNDCSEADAQAEGVTRIGTRGSPIAGPNFFSVEWQAAGCQLRWSLNAPTAAGAYAMLWDHINGEGSWAANPWVWVVGFRRVGP